MQNRWWVPRLLWMKACQLQSCSYLLQRAGRTGALARQMRLYWIYATMLIVQGFLAGVKEISRFPPVFISRFPPVFMQQ